MPTLAPNGELLAYASDRAGRGDLDIWVQQTSGGVPLRLTDDSADDQAVSGHARGDDPPFSFRKRGAHQRPRALAGSEGKNGRKVRRFHCLA